MKTLLTRTLTGIFLVLILLGGFLLHPLSFILIGFIIVVGVSYELGELSSPDADKFQIFTATILAITIYGLSSLVASGVLELKYLTLLLLIIPLTIIPELYMLKGKSVSRIGKSLFNSLYASLPYTLMVVLAYGSDGISSLLAPDSLIFSPEQVIGFFILIWINDSGAYLLGSSFGKHKLFEKVSPKKSWEGFFGGLILTVLVAWFFGPYFSGISRFNWIIVAFLVSVGSTYGDLFASVIKRNAGVKDSGKILPGHGGFLDRFDGVALAFPLVYLYLTFFG